MADIRSLGALLDRLTELAGNRNRIEARELVDIAGRRSFGVLIMVPAIISFTPIGVVPGVPTTLAAFVAVVASQVLIGRRKIWLPGFLARRTVSRRTVERAVFIMRPAARVIDWVVHPRLAFLTGEIFLRFAALVCLMVAAIVPPLDFIPFGDVVPWVAISLFGLALVAHDGLLAMLGVATVLTLPWVVARLLL